MHTLRPLYLAILVLAAALLACNVPGWGRVPLTATPTPAAMPTAAVETPAPPVSSAPPEATAEEPTVAETLPLSLELGEVLYSTDFRTGWVDYADESTRFVVTPDGYLVDVGAAWAAWQFVSRDFPARSYVETTAQAQICPGISSFGVIFRYRDDGNFYAFAVNCTGGWVLKTRRGGEWYAPLLSGALPPEQFAGLDGTHRIGMRGDGPQLTVFYDGEALGTIRDEAFREGDTGVFVEAATDDLTRVLFTQLSVWALP